MTSHTSGAADLPDALRLADFLQGAFALDWTGEAAAELRRLHSENERLAALAAGQAVAPVSPNGYPALPEPYAHITADGGSVVKGSVKPMDKCCFSILQMFAFVDADRATRPAPPATHVGESAFESWYSTYNPAHKSDKQRARDAYAAGMGDPLVIAATPPTQARDSAQEDAHALLQDVAACFTRDDDLPDNLLPRIDSVLAARKQGQPHDHR